MGNTAAAGGHDTILGWLPVISLFFWLQGHIYHVVWVSPEPGAGATAGPSCLPPGTCQLENTVSGKAVIKLCESFLNDAALLITLMLGKTKNKHQHKTPQPSLI